MNGSECSECNAIEHEVWCSLNTAQPEPVSVSRWVAFDQHDAEMMTFELGEHVTPEFALRYAQQRPVWGVGIETRTAVRVERR